MAKYFLGTVGKAEALRYNAETGKQEIAFVSKTLTDSGINITTTKDDVRAGQGAPVQFSFYHDSNVEITLTDVLWKPAYLEAQLGAQFVQNNEDYKQAEVVFTAGAGTLAEAAAKIPFPCGEDYVLWGAKKGTEDWVAVHSDDGTALTLDDATAAGTYCVRYLGTVSGAKQAEITSTILPEELFLIITAPIFAGDSCAASNGKLAGHITFEVPRFRLNGTQEFAFNMSQNQTLSLAGIALASDSADCDADGGKLLRVIEVITNNKSTDGVVSLVVDEDFLKVGDSPAVYGLTADGGVKKIANSDLTFDPVLSSGRWANAIPQTITITGTAVTDTVTITAA